MVAFLEEKRERSIQISFKFFFLIYEYNREINLASII